MDLEDLLGGSPGPTLHHTPHGTVVVESESGMGNQQQQQQQQQREHKRRRTAHCGDGDGADQTPPEMPGRRCFVTIGATAGFRSLLEEVSSPPFFACLAAHGFADLHVQCGPDRTFFAARVAALSEQQRHGLAVVSFDYTDEMTANILACRGEDGVRPAGCVLAHGGTGTVGEVLSVGAPLIVVANPTLMDNHQLELAESLEEQGVAVHGRIGASSQGTLDALPPYLPPPFPVPAADRVTLFDWMVLTCYPEELARQQHLADLGEADVEFAEHQQQIANQDEDHGNGGETSVAPGGNVEADAQSSHAQTTSIANTGNQNEDKPAPIDVDEANESLSYLAEISAQVASNFPVLSTLNDTPQPSGGPVLPHLTHLFTYPSSPTIIPVLQTINLAAASPIPLPQPDNHSDDGYELFPPFIDILAAQTQTNTNTTPNGVTTNGATPQTINPFSAPPPLTNGAAPYTNGINPSTPNSFTNPSPLLTNGTAPQPTESFPT
ncbi:N-acetylglucosaminyldiphosphodolichol N-acetylglucosaminyltransferase catalytic subunit alg13 [Collariella sp. IMI 366227]|nr:N-acetylglucosaminyldiphosphodolichol N-acetylglucosaminyltransferase catalytic subunit alg13 [Collariella sp. IMI 366227]